jgi:hypothetical protein
VGPRAILDAAQKRKIFYLCLELNPSLLVVHSAARRHTDGKKKKERIKAVRKRVVRELNERQRE